MAYTISYIATSDGIDLQQSRTVIDEFVNWVEASADRTYRKHIFTAHKDALFISVTIQDVTDLDAAMSSFDTFVDEDINGALGANFPLPSNASSISSGSGSP